MNSYTYSHEALRTALQMWSQPKVQTQDVNTMSESTIADGQMLLTDCVGGVELFIVEGNVDGPTKFRGKFQEANTQNKNKREYPYDVLEKNVNRLMETVKKRGLVGELDHPTDSIIHFEKASHVITNLWWEGNVLMGEGEVLPTPHGRILENLIKAGIRTGISSRGVGNGQVNNEGVLIIGESYKLITFDAVADPSTSDAYQTLITKTTRRESTTPQPVMQEVPGDDVNSPNKNEPTGINNNTNDNALVAYIGQFIRNETERIKKDII